MGASMKIDADTQKSALKENTKLSFEGDGETFNKAQLTYPDSSMV